MAKTVGGVTTRYLVDTNNLTGYAQVVEELQGGAVTRQYAYGHDLVSQRQLVSGSRLTSFYGYDGHGSVRALTDEAGAVTDTYTYDAFGTLISRTGATPNEYLYADGNPANKIDPSGHSAFAHAIGAIQSIVIRATVFVLYSQRLHAVLGAIHLFKMVTDEAYAYNFFAAMNPHDAMRILASDAGLIAGVLRPRPVVVPTSSPSPTRVKFPNLYPDDIPNPVRVSRLENVDGRWIVRTPGGEVRTASGRFIFVTIEGRIYAVQNSARAGAQHIGHIDISNGRAVDYAGEIRFGGRNSRGVLQGWSNASGHYKPHPDNIDQAGLPLDKFTPVEFAGSPQRGIPVIETEP